ncbi:MAG: class I SAM-dependent methyltransferase [Cellulomonas sp.]|uniref:class I SAM-dependent methyltransferase n=1 Tax=Cellulomonas sp. TaxID=40001 RepID=UPI0019EBE433|nr:class I SAM-dependent methyltransferase [Cellulomonas sp.]MBF0686339.1 class I SAM-dependent methyltransferase [Cellulomonas sp.]MBF0687219.1 class I SAM-dependent methyltransferase [Cellulomonas sp.]
MATRVGGGPSSPGAPLAPNAWLRWDVVQRRLRGGEGRLLEIGCGRGAFGARLASQFQYTAVEPDPVAWEHAAATVGEVAPDARVVLGDVSSLGGEGGFDVVCAFEVLEHIEDDHAVLESWLSCLRPGGMLLLSMPAGSSRMGPWDEAVGHFRRYDPEALEEQLTRHGLVDIEVTCYGTPLGYVTEAVRNSVARTRRVVEEGATTAERTARSNRLLQPGPGLVAVATQVGTWPFCMLQRAFPGRGTGLVVSARASG